MGHKVNPVAFRIGVNRGWKAGWFARKSMYRSFLEQDVKIRVFLTKHLRDALVDTINMERSRGALNIIVWSAKPGQIIGRSGAGIEELSKKLKDMFFRGRRVNMSLSVKEVAKPTLSSVIVATQIAMDLEKRMPFRRVMKGAMDRVMKGGALGVKVMISGRLNGAEIARTEMLAHGKIPLQNLRADIDFGTARAWTTYGVIGVKVWINRGEIFEEKKQETLHP
ncbi:30S ribosomal protein S3 [Candidatus Uhrbacteria bacterium]|nr:30S ribosomal protein S3 [Candidatus Uhrbacteria bacterium]